ncbi:5688_t:CDS:2 [Rhizophagus irregularis]|nr:5688_t:CDS:2 [Rhizophagus irregularis]
MSDNMLSYYLDILIAADELALIELIDYLVEYILKKETFWFRRNLVKIHRISSQHEAFHKLKTTCINNEDDTGICSRVKNNVNKVGCAGQEKLPWFGNDLNWIKGVCKQQIYEKQIVDFEKFNSEDVEVYKVLLKVNNNNIFFDEYNDDHTTIFNSEIIEY